MQQQVDRTDDTSRKASRSFIYYLIDEEYWGNQDNQIRYNRHLLIIPTLIHMSTSECASPTRCRPQHLDRERLRGVLSARQYADVRYHEAVVAASSATPKSFQLLALAADCLYLFPLASSQLGSNPPTRIRFKDVLAMDVASPALSGQRGMMLEPGSQLFHILVREKPKANPKETKSKSLKKAVAAKDEEPCGWTQSEFFVSTFEPDSRVFFYVSQAFQAYFQVSRSCPQVSLLAVH